jgi:hypothetical protein
MAKTRFKHEAHEDSEGRVCDAPANRQRPLRDLQRAKRAFAFFVSFVLK